MYKVTLDPKKGKSYDVGGTIFKAGAPRSVPEDLGKYLKGNDFFIVESQNDLLIKDESIKSPAGDQLSEPPEGNPLLEVYSEEDLKKMKKDEQEQLIQTLGGDVSTTTNGTERIALILELQEKLEEIGPE